MAGRMEDNKDRGLGEREWMVMLCDKIVKGSKNDESIEVKLFLKCIMILSLKIMSRCRKNQISRFLEINPEHYDRL